MCCVVVLSEQNSRGYLPRSGQQYYIYLHTVWSNLSIRGGRWICVKFSEKGGFCSVYGAELCVQTWPGLNSRSGKSEDHESYSKPLVSRFLPRLIGSAAQQGLLRTGKTNDEDSSKDSQKTSHRIQLYGDRHVSERLPRRREDSVDATLRPSSSVAAPMGCTSMRKSERISCSGTHQHTHAHKKKKKKKE